MTVLRLHTLRSEMFEKKNHQKSKLIMMQKLSNLLPKSSIHGLEREIGKLKNQLPILKLNVLSN